MKPFLKVEIEDTLLFPFLDLESNKISRKIYLKSLSTSKIIYASTRME
jgi:hypothetical protein